MCFYLEWLYIQTVQPSVFACRPDRQIFGWGPLAHGKVLVQWLSPLAEGVGSGLSTLRDVVQGVSVTAYTIGTYPLRSFWSHLSACVAYPIRLVKEIYEACHILARNPITLALKPGLSATAAEILAIPAWSMTAGVLGALFGGPAGCIMFAAAACICTQTMTPMSYVFSAIFQAVAGPVF